MRLFRNHTAARLVSLVGIVALTLLLVPTSGLAEAVTTADESVQQVQVIDETQVTDSVAAEETAAEDATAEKTTVADESTSEEAVTSDQPATVASDATQDDATVVTDAQPQTSDEAVSQADTYHVTYVATGSMPDGYAVPTDTTAYSAGDTVTVPDVSIPAYYTFSGWSYDGSVVTSFTMPDSDVTLTGTWDRYAVPWNGATVTYSVSGDVPDGYTVPTDEITYQSGEDVTVAAVPVREGYTFTGWTYDGNIVTSVTVGSEDIELTSTWSKDAVVISNDGTTDDAYTIVTDTSQDTATSTESTSEPAATQVSSTTTTTLPKTADTTTAPGLMALVALLGGTCLVGAVAKRRRSE